MNKKPSPRKKAGEKNGEKPAEEGLKPKPTVVAIGASAGGLGALRAFFDLVPADSGLAFVIVVHLSPEHKSHLADLLQPHAKMPVLQVTKDMPLVTNQIYIIPPNANLNAIDTHVRPTKLEESRRERAPIDHFLRTLASSHDGGSVAVILTGTGSDGTLGIKDIKAKGGLVIVQDPNDAEYDGMPQSAIASGVADLVLPLAEIPGTLLRFDSITPKVNIANEDEKLEREDTQLLQKILAQLRARTERDFSRYKRSTILRRIARRMQLNYVEELGAYLHLLREHPEEARALADDLLITVTNFFRDPEAFAKLEKDVIPRLLEGKRQTDSVRAWSVGCATGEEAYSLAILLAEAASRLDSPPRIQVFASDLHRHSLDRAREGLYPGDIETDVSAERLKRFFRRENGAYRINKEIRDLVVFAPHNLLSDPPFSRLDLVSCRNLLIYLQRDVQRDVVDLFHYALNPGGFLILGSAETIESPELFRTEDKGLRLYAKRNVTGPEPRLPVFPPLARFRMEQANRKESPAEPVAYATLLQRTLQAYAPPSLLIDPENKLAQLAAGAGRYLVHPSGDLTSNVFKLLREELRLELRAALQTVRDSRSSFDSAPIAVRFNGHSGAVTMLSRPVLEPGHEDFVLVMFEERGTPLHAEPGEAAGAAEQAAGGPDRRIAELESELNVLRQRLQALVEEYETGQEEMKASNEEMQSTNEELRSTMEELETSKEELQSINEELQTVNQENRHKVEELAQLSSDLQNLLAATDIATLFLDRDLRILRFTPKISELFNVRTTDRGRPISDLTHRLGYNELQKDAREVLKRLIPIEREVLDDSGRWYLTRVLPYRSSEDRIEGTVITFVDITRRKESEEAVRSSEERMRRMINVEGVGAMIFNEAGMLIDSSDAFLKMCGYSRADVASGRLSWRDITPPEYVQTVERQLEKLKSTGHFGPYEKEYVRKDGSRSWMLAAGASLGDGTVVEYCIDVMDRKQAEEKLIEAKIYAEAIIDTLHEPLLVLGPDLRVKSANPAFYSVFQVDRERTIGKRVYDLGNRQWNIPALRRLLEEVLPQNDSFDDFEVEHEFEGIGRRVMLLNARKLEHQQLILLGLRDITDRKTAEEAVRQSEERYRLLVESAHEYAMILLDDRGRISAWNTGAERIFGYSQEEALGLPSRAIFTPEDQQAGIPEAEMETAARTGRADDDRWQMRKDGSRFWASGVMERLRKPDGTLRGYVKVLRDNTERREAEERLRQANESLEDRVRTRTQEVRELSSTLTMAEHRERDRIAQVLHDDLQQQLYGLRVNLMFLREAMEAGSQEESIARAAKAERELGESIELTRRLSIDLSPQVLKQEGLREMVRWLADQMKTQYQLHVELQADSGFPAPQPLRVLLFQSVRELLFNVIKHARVKHTKVELRQADDVFLVRVTDTGNGFDGAGGSAGFGLSNIGYRLSLIGGDLAVDSKPGTGTTVTLRVPVALLSEETE